MKWQQLIDKKDRLVLLYESQGPFETFTKPNPPYQLSIKQRLPPVLNQRELDTYSLSCSESHHLFFTIHRGAFWNQLTGQTDYSTGYLYLEQHGLK